MAKKTTVTTRPEPSDGWPPHWKLPTETEVRQAMQAMQERLVELHKELDEKVKPPSSELLRTIIDI